MTSTLQRFHGEEIRVHVLESRHDDVCYAREVLLVTRDTRRTVEFGAIEIRLELFPAGAQREIFRAEMPLGTILRSFRIDYVSHPRAFFQIESDDLMNAAFTLSHTQTLYGRCNEITNKEGQILAGIVEILPPANRSPEKCLINTISSTRIVIGAGPAGSASAASLTEYGHRVLMLERAKFPRYHIGESLIPFTFHPLERLGLIPAMKSSAFVRKYSIQFAAPSGKVSQPFYFFNRYDRETVAQTWQVLRSEFDQILLDNARAKGAEVREETAVKELIWEDTRVAGVIAQDKAGTLTEYRAPITLDCTGKEAFTAVHQGWRVRDPYLNKVAVWTYYRGAKRDPGIDEGATTVAYVPEKGWFWFIPQHNDMVSVGVVAEGKYLVARRREVARANVQT